MIKLKNSPTLKELRETIDLLIRDCDAEAWDWNGWDDGDLYIYNDDSQGKIIETFVIGNNND